MYTAPVEEPVALAVTGEFELLLIEEARY